MMSVKKTVFISVVILLIAFLYHYEVKVDYWTSVHSTSIEAKLDDVFNLITNPDQTGKWFKWISYLRPIDKKPLAAKKLYDAVIDIPLYGELLVRCKVREFIPKHKVVVESKWMFRPRIEIHMYQAHPNEVRMTMKMKHRRRSLLFNIFVAPTLSYLADQQVQRSLFLLRTLFPRG